MATYKRQDPEIEPMLVERLTHQMDMAVHDRISELPKEIPADTVIRELSKFSETQLIDISEALGYHRNWATNTGDHYQDITVTSIVKVLRAYGLHLAIVTDVDIPNHRATPLYFLRESQVMPEEVRREKEKRREAYRIRREEKKKNQEAKNK